MKKYDSIFVSKLNKGITESGNIRSSYEYVQKLDLPKDFSFLDLGCNTGSLINMLYDSGYHSVFGVDVSKQAIIYGRKNYPKISKNIKSYQGHKLPYESNSFDVVLMFDVIEHIPTVDNFMRTEINRILKPGGLLIFQTPNKYLNILWVYISNRSLKVKWWEDHCSLQTVYSLKKLLSISGFEDIVIEKNNINNEYNTQKLKSKIGYFSIIVIKLFKYMPIYFFPNLFGHARKLDK